jgi:hypothetical protein
MSTLYVNTITPNSGDTVTISGSLNTTGKFTVGDASTDSIIFNAEVSSSIIPDTGGTYALGTMAKSWGSLHVHGLGHVHTASIGVVSSSLLPDADDSHDLGSSGRQWKDLYVDGTANLDVVDIDGAVDMASHLVIAGNITSSGNISSSGTITGNSIVGTIATAAQTNITSVGILPTLSASVINAPTLTATTLNSTHVIASNLIVSGVNFKSSVLASVDAAHLGSADGFNKFSVQGQLQAAVADAATSAEFTVGNTDIALGDVVFGTIHGALMGGLSQSSMIIATRTANSMSFVFNNESGLVAVDNSAFTASFVVIK